MSETVAAVAELQRRLERLSADFIDRYGDDLSRLEIDRQGDVPIVRGTLVVAKQRRALESVLRDWPAALPAPELDVVALEGLARDDPRLEGGWVELGDDRPAALWSRRVGGALASEWLSDDGPARLLHKARPRQLVQLRDATVAWVDVDRVTTSDGPVSSADFPMALRRAEGCAVTAQELDRLTALALRAAEEAIAYRLGGRSPQTGLDCSALTQRLIETATGALLPRHSGDQMQVGERVGRQHLAVGDLVFARAPDANILHVGLLIDGAEGLGIVHACRVEGRVIGQSLQDFLNRYRYLRAQRPLWSPAVPGGKPV